MKREVIIMENKNLIMLASITYAIKAKEVLGKRGIRSEIVRTPRHKSRAGCGYSLYVPRSFSQAVSIIKASGLKILGIIGEGDKR